MDAIPLEPADRAILDIECETIAGHTCKVIRLGPGAPSATAIRARVAERIGGVDAMTRRLGGNAEAPAWVPWEGLDLERRVVERSPAGEGDLPAQVAALFEQRLDRSRPLWQMDVVPTADDGAAIVWRIHHSLADGTAAMRFARDLLWDGPAGDAAPSSGQAHPRSQRADDARRRRHLTAFIEREFGESIHRSPFDGEIGTTRRIAFATVDLHALHDEAKRVADATLNDAVLSIVAGALRRWVIHHHGSLGGLRVRVPVSLHHEGDDVANRDSFFSLRLPLNEPDPVRRLREVKLATAARKASNDAEQREELLREIAAHSPRLQGFYERLEASPRSFALSVSNVPGPREPVSILGAPVTSIHSIAEIGSRHALRVAVVSLAGNLHFGFCADPGIVDDLSEMASGVEIEAADLAAASAL